MNKALVTGGAGFIGSHVVERLIREGWSVRILDNFSTGSYANLRNSRVEIVEGDIRNVESCYAACHGVNAVFHIAAIASVASSIAAPQASHDVNLGGTLNMLCAASDMNVKRFVFSSSASVYGNADAIPTKETQALWPMSPYATSKAAGEFYCRNYFEIHGLETVILRYFNVYGPRQSATSGYAAVVPLFVKAALSDGAVTVYGDGLQTRDFVYVETVAEANFLAATVPAAAGKILNVAGGAQISLIELLDSLSAITGNEMRPTFVPARPGEVRDSRADITLATNALGFKPRVTLSEGLRRTVAAARPERIPAPATVDYGLAAAAAA